MKNVQKQFFLYQLPNENQLKREITKGRAWSQIEALSLLNVFHKYRCLVYSLGNARTIGMFHHRFLVNQIPNE